MGHITRSHLDHDSTAPRYPDGYPDDLLQDSPRKPGILVVAAAVLAFAVCVANFALGQAGAGVAAGIVALLAFGGGLAWLSMDRRAIRQAERDWVISHPARSR